MKIKVNEQDILMLEKSKHAYLLSGDTNRIFLVEDFTIEEGEEVIVKKKWFSKKSESTTVKQMYLTAIQVQSYHSVGKFVGYLTDEAVLVFLRRDLYRLRQNWLDLKQMLKCFGLEVIKEKATDDKQLMQSAEDHLKEFFRESGYENQSDIVKYAVSFAKSQMNKS